MDIDIKILIATHKPCWFPTDRIYLPIQVGSSGKESILPGIQRDDEGVNISEKNNLYCELTAQYWGWKNLICDYIGLVQYRRFFKGKKSINHERKILGEAELLALLAKEEIVLPQKRHYFIETLEQHFDNYDFSEPDDLLLLRDVINDISPDYLASFDNIFRLRAGHMFNMFIMNKKLFDKFCEWEFLILEEIERRIEIVRSRLIGYFAEHMLDIWIDKNKLSYVEHPIYLLDKKNDLGRKIDFLLRKTPIKYRFIKL